MKATFEASLQMGFESQVVSSFTRFLVPESDKNRVQLPVTQTSKAMTNHFSPGKLGHCAVGCTIRAPLLFFSHFCGEHTFPSRRQNLHFLPRLFHNLFSESFRYQCGCSSCTKLSLAVGFSSRTDYL